MAEGEGAVVKCGTNGQEKTSEVRWLTGDYTHSAANTAKHNIHHGGTENSKELVFRFGVLIVVRYNSCYTKGVKTAISLPEDLFRLAEAAARKLKMSRSQLYATALAEYLERRKTSNITDRLNRIYSRESSELDPALQSAQMRSLEREDW
jgi:hypothetical protein